MTALWAGQGYVGHGSSVCGGVHNGNGYGHGYTNGNDGYGYSYDYASDGIGDGIGWDNEDNYSEGYGYPEQDIETSRVAIGRALIEHPSLAVVELTTLAVTP